MGESEGQQQATRRLEWEQAASKCLRYKKIRKKSVEMRRPVFSSCSHDAVRSLLLFVVPRQIKRAQDDIRNHFAGLSRTNDACKTY
jgi:hypothetical protein